jgi:hypothetical protein
LPGTDRVAVPRLLSRSVTTWLSLAAAVVAVPAVVAWAWVTQPDSRIPSVVVGVLLLGGLGILVSRRTWLDTRQGLVVHEVVFVFRRPTPWADAKVVKFTDNRVGQLMLEVRGAERRTSTYVPLVAVDMGGDRSQSPEFLGVLADQIESWSPQRAAVVTKLRAQAEHLRSGGPVRESPLARAHLTRTR